MREADPLHLGLRKGGRSGLSDLHGPPPPGREVGWRVREPWSLELPGWAIAGGRHAQWVRRAAPLLLARIRDSILVPSRPWDPGQFHFRSSPRKGLEAQKFSLGNFRKDLAFGSKSPELFKG